MQSQLLQARSHLCHSPVHFRRSRRFTIFWVTTAARESQMKIRSRLLAVCTL